MAEFAERVLVIVEGQQWLDKPSHKLEHGLALVLNLLGDAVQPVRNALHGTWLRQPVHPVLNDLPMGAWTLALLFDGADALAPGRAGAGAAAQVSVAVGLVGGAGAAATGLSDWQYTQGDARRLGLTHGLLNSVVLGLYAASWLDRRRGRSRRARVLSGVGYGLLQASGHAGGRLVFRHGIGVDHANRQLAPREFVAVLTESELNKLEEGQPRGVDADGTAVVLVRCGDTVHALGARCAHLGGPLTEGVVHRGGIACPWHGSRYELASGRVLDGPATAPLPCFQTRLRNGQFEVRRRPPVPTATPGVVVAGEQGAPDARD